MYRTEAARIGYRAQNAVMDSKQATAEYGLVFIHFVMEIYNVLQVRFVVIRY